MKVKSDECYINLLIINEIAVILSDKYDQICFYNIVICFCHTEGAQQGFSYIYSNYAIYIPLQYPLLFSYNDSGWIWILQLQRQNEQISRVNMLQ